MSSGLVLRLAALAVIVGVIWLARREHHQCEAGAEVFRYRAVFSWCAFGAALGLAWLALAIATPVLAAARTAPLPWMRLLLSLMPWYLFLIAAMCAWGAAFLRMHAIEVRPGELVVHDIQAIRSIDPHSVRRFVEYTARASGLALYDESGRLMLRISGLIEDYGDLVDLIRAALPAEGVNYERRGIFGLRVD